MVCTNKTIRFAEKSFFCVIPGSTQAHSAELSDILGFVQIILRFYKSDKPINITSIDKNHLKSDCIQGSIVNGIREPTLYSSALSSPPGHKIHKEPRV